MAAALARNRSGARWRRRRDEGQQREASSGDGQRGNSRRGARAASEVLGRLPPPRGKSKVEMVSDSGVCAPCVVVDARHHMLSLLTLIVAKKLLNEPCVVVIRCEICTSDRLVRQKMKNLQFPHKWMNTKPSHGPIHFYAPAKILWHTVRGMIPHKTKRGEATLERVGQRPERSGSITTRRRGRHAGGIRGGRRASGRLE